MSTTVTGPRVADRLRGHAQPGTLGAYTVLAGTLISLVGIGWDVQWHIDVGPDTFFTLSHLLLYSGSAIAGIASLVMVLRATAAQRAGVPVDHAIGGTPVRVLGGTFTAPLGYLVSGAGAALFLLYGLMDLWWHSLYGFDAVLNSPPHVALFTTISITMVGSVIVCAAARHHRWGRIGMVISIPVLVTFTPLTTNAFDGLALPVNPTLAGTVFFTVLLVTMGALTLRSHGSALTIAAVLGVIQLFLWWFSPWAAHAYAAYEELPLRDNLVERAPELASSMPMFALLMAAVIEAFQWQRREHHRSGRSLLMGGGAGLVIGASMPLQRDLLGTGTTVAIPTMINGAVAGLVLGALAGFLAARFAVMLRAQTPSTSPTPESL